MRTPKLIAIAVLLWLTSAFAQSNKIVFGPLEGDNPGVLTARNGQDIYIQIWVRTDPDNLAPVTVVQHGLLSNNDIIAARNGVWWSTAYDMPNWDSTFVDGPYLYHPDDAHPIPEGYSCEMQGAIYDIFGDPQGDPLDTGGEWDLYGYFLMTCNTDVPTGNTYYPFSMGWYPHNGEGTRWEFDDPPGGQVVPFHAYCGLHFPDPGLNKIVFGPLEGDDAGVLTVHNCEAIGIEMWVRSDPENPADIWGVSHGLMSENLIIDERNGIDPEPYYDCPPWEQFFIDGPYVHDPEDNFHIPEGWTCEMQGALCCWWVGSPYVPIDTDGEWDLYGTWLMVTNSGIPVNQIYYSLMEGWYPHSGQGTAWSFECPPCGHVHPDQSYCGLYFESDTCIYIPGDVNRNGAALELADVLAMIASYRGLVEPYYLCNCNEDPPVYDFAATADPNGNCVPNELNDVITELAAYRGLAEVSGCPDCPGSE